MEKVKIGEIFKYMPKSKIKAGEGKKKGKYKFFTSSNIQNKYIDEYVYDGEYLIFGTGGKASINYCNDKFTTSTDNFVVDVKKEFSAKLVYLYFRNNMQKLENGFKGAGIKHISKEYINNLMIPKYNLNYQKYIVKTLSLIQEIIDIRKKQIEELDELIKSQFVEMFGDPIINEKKWNTEKISDIAPTKAYKGILNKKVWLLNLDMVEAQSGKIIEYVYEDIENIGNSTNAFCEANILYSKLRPYLNKVVIPTEKGISTSELVPLLPNKEKLNRIYFAYLLRSKEFVDYISEKVTGAKMPRVSMDIFRRFEIMLPPINLQNQFADMIKQIDKQKFEIQKSLNETEELMESLMNEYLGV